jgi:hypothetical protein
MDEQGGHDLCVGSDAFVFGSLGEIEAGRAIPLNRADPAWTTPSGARAFLAKYPALGGFVPLGATLPDGRPHPAAGSGFCLSECLTFREDRSDFLPAPEGGSFIERIDLRWDGRALSVGSGIFDPGSIGIEGGASIGFNAVPDGEGLLFPLTTRQGIAVARFEWDGARWNAAGRSATFATEPGRESEPSIRRAGGILYVHTRGRASGRIYASEDGMDFRLLAERPNLDVPQVLNQLPDGSLYVAGNAGPGIRREPLLAWPFDGTRFGEPVTVRRQEGETPFVDHAIGSNVLLEGRVRHLLTSRVCELMDRNIAPSLRGLEEAAHGGRPVNRGKRPWSGLYLNEIGT